VKKKTQESEVTNFDTKNEKQISVDKKLWRSEREKMRVLKITNSEK
jgi:hypothetical protein